MTRVIVGNLNRATGAASPRRCQEVLHALEEQFDPDVWLLVETNGIRPRRLLGRKHWDTHQGHLAGRGNNAVVWDTQYPATQKRFWVGTLGRKGFTMDPRWINRARVAGVGWTVLHIPPERYQSLVPDMMRRMSLHTHSPRLTWAGDKNAAPMREWAQAHGYHYRDHGAMFLASDLPILRFQPVNFAGFDHAFLVADIGHQ